MLTISDFDQLKSKDPGIRFGFAKELLQTAKSDPEKLYPFFEIFKELLTEKNQILKWTGIDILGLLAASKPGFNANELTDDLIKLLSSGKLITANHAIFALTQIANAKPEIKPRILSELLKVEHHEFETGECRNIAIGKVIEALKELKIEPDKVVRRFLEKSSTNTRNATKKKAVQLLHRLERLKTLA
jgi:hypothetical protein